MTEINANPVTHDGEASPYTKGLEIDSETGEDLTQERASIALKEIDDIALEQADAMWESARQSRRAVTVATFGTFVNSLVVAVAVLMPIYQSSRDDIDRQIEHKRNLIMTISAEMRDLAKAYDSVGPNGRINFEDCKKLDIEDNKFLLQSINSYIDGINRESLYLYNIRDNDSEIIESTQHLNDLSVNLSRYLDLLTDISTQPSSWPTSARTGWCKEHISTLYSDMETSASDIAALNLEYEAPIRRPFGFLNGKTESPAPIGIVFSGCGCGINVENISIFREKLIQQKNDIDTSIE